MVILNMAVGVGSPDRFPCSSGKVELTWLDGIHLEYVIVVLLVVSGFCLACSKSFGCSAMVLNLFEEVLRCCIHTYHILYRNIYELDSRGLRIICSRLVNGSIWC